MGIVYRLMQARARQARRGAGAARADGELCATRAGRQRNPTLADIESQTGGNTETLKESKRHALSITLIGAQLQWWLEQRVVVHRAVHDRAHRVMRFKPLNR